MWKNGFLDAEISIDLAQNGVELLLDYLNSPDVKSVRRFIGISNEDDFANATSFLIHPNLIEEKSSWKGAIAELVRDVKHD